MSSRRKSYSSSGSASSGAFSPASSTICSWMVNLAEYSPRYKCSSSTSSDPDSPVGLLPAAINNYFSAQYCTTINQGSAGDSHRLMRKRKAMAVRKSSNSSSSCGRGHGSCRSRQCHHRHHHHHHHQLQIPCVIKARLRSLLRTLKRSCRRLALLASWAASQIISRRPPSSTLYLSKRRRSTSPSTASSSSSSSRLVNNPSSTFASAYCSSSYPNAVADCIEFIKKSSLSGC